MSTTLQQTINWAQAFIDYSPLTAGTGNEPAVTTANNIQEMLTSAPLFWPWNRDVYAFDITKAEGQDYSLLLTDFNYLEKVTLEDSAGRFYEIKDVFNNRSTSLNAATQRPFAVSVMEADYDSDADVSGGNVWIRFNAVPDQNYSANLIFQTLPTPIATPSDSWYIPDTLKSIYSWLFLAEAFQAVDDDQRAMQYRQRGVAALLARQAGLSELDRSVILAQWTGRELQVVRDQLKTQQSVQARGV